MLARQILAIDDPTAGVYQLAEPIECGSRVEGVAQAFPSHNDFSRLHGARSIMRFPSFRELLRRCRSRHRYCREPLVNEGNRPLDRTILSLNRERGCKTVHDHIESLSRAAPQLYDVRLHNVYRGSLSCGFFRLHARSRGAGASPSSRRRVGCADRTPGDRIDPSEHARVVRPLWNTEPRGARNRSGDERRTPGHPRIHQRPHFLRRSPRCARSTIQALKAPISSTT